MGVGVLQGRLGPYPIDAPLTSDLRIFGHSEDHVTVDPLLGEASIVAPSGGAKGQIAGPVSCSDRWDRPALRGRRQGSSRLAFDPFRSVRE